MGSRVTVESLVTDALSTRNLAIETFDGDVDALADLIDRAWARDYRDAMRFDYSPSFLQWNFDGPTRDPHLLLGAYEGRKLVSFCARLPRVVAGQGQTMRAPLGTFLTTDVDYRGRGLARRLIWESVARMRAKDCAGYFFYLQHGHRSTPLYDQLPLPSEVVVKDVRFYVRVLDSQALEATWRSSWFEHAAMRWLEGRDVQAGDSAVRQFTEADLPACTALLNHQTDAVLVRQWQESELRWRLTGYADSCVVVFEEQGTVRGLLSAYVTDIVGSRWGTARPRVGAVGRIRAGFIDTLAIDGLSPTQLRALLAGGLRAIKEAGCAVAICASHHLHRRSLLRNWFVPDVYTPMIDLRFARLQPDVALSTVKGLVTLDMM